LGVFWVFPVLAGPKNSFVADEKGLLDKSEVDEDEELNPNAIDDGNVAVFSQTFLNEGKGV
jgi:hypothetical protein